MSYPRLALKPTRERSLINKHPWVFSGGVLKMPNIENGTIVEVVDAKNNILGYGFFSDKSQITCRMFHFGKLAEGQFFDQSYWFKFFENAYNRRKTIIDFSTTNCYRLIHAEGDFLPGLVVDIYDKVAVVQILIKGIENLKNVIVSNLKSLGFEYVYFKNKTGAQNAEQISLVSGWLTKPFIGNIIAKENNVKFAIDIENGQKTGFFIDQRDNRAELGKIAKGKRILNCFSYSGGFSMYALLNEASEVHSVDISALAAQECNENAILNNVEDKHQAFAEDCFEYLRHKATGYDVIVLDPPAFAKNVRSVPNATKGYKDINLLAFKHINKGGLVFTYSCSQHISRDLFQKIIFGAALDSGRNVQIIKHLNQSSDHPISIFHPEGDYLKGLLLYVE